MTLVRDERLLWEHEHALAPNRPRDHFSCKICHNNEVPSAYDHVSYENVNMESTDDYGWAFMTERTVEAPYSQADVISSEVEDHRGWHTVMLDIDMSAKLVPSSTEGHFHLYIDKLMPWRKYRKLLRALRDAGVIESGFYSSSVARRATHLRPPWRSKYE